ASAVMRGAAPALAGRFGPKPSSEEIMSVLVGRGDMPGYGAAMGYEDARDILLWLGRLDPETGQHPGKKPPTLQTPPERPADKAPPGSPGQDTEASRAEPSPSQPG
ncbi:MAG: hypothetical protein VX000_01580, partial [Myxococcota bacterium]|nr:hypothetical protein [Myxococcota bacterium]